MSETKIKRHEIYWVSLNPGKGHEMQKTRPCVVVSPDAMHLAGMAVICPLTSKLHPQWAHRIEIVCNGEVNEIMVDQIRSVSLKRFRDYFGRLDEKDIQSLQDVISRMFA